MSQNSYLLLVWLTMTVMGVSAMAAALLWAVRSRQFQHQDHARRLALESHIPTDAQWEEIRREEGSRDAGILPARGEGVPPSPPPPTAGETPATRHGQDARATGGDDVRQ